MKNFIVALVCISSAFADVSEIIHHHPEHQEARPFDILTINLNVEHQPSLEHNVEHQPSTLEHFSEAIHVEEPAAVGFGLSNEGVENVEAIEVLPVVDADAVVKRVQLTEAHADYQGPYHYEKPNIQLKYGAPLPTPVEPTVPVEPPTLKDQPNNYLPPAYTGANLVKRHAKYIVRRRV